MEYTNGKITVTAEFHGEHVFIQDVETGKYNEMDIVDFFNNFESCDNLED